MAESPVDPTAIWRDLIVQWEQGFNNLANQTMGSGEFSRYMNQAMTLSMKMQNSMGEVMGRYLKAMNLPNREEIVHLDKRLDAIELELQRLSAGMDRLTRDGSDKKHSHKPTAANEAAASGKITDERRVGGAWDPNALVSRLQTEIARSIQRSVNGLEFLASPSPAVGITPKDVILKRGTLNLYHYYPRVDELYRVPLLIVTATTNRGYLFDLVPGQSFVEFLLDRGFDVYLLDWTAPVAAESRLSMEDYILDFLPDCVRCVQEDSGEPDLSILGYCMGGVLSVSYAALHAGGPLKNLLCVTTPIDFSAMALFRTWGDREHFDVDSFVDSVGIVPAEFVFSSFSMLRPASQTASRVQLWDNMWNDEFVKSYRVFDKWLNETLPLAGEIFRQTVKELVQGNKLCKNELKIGGRLVDLRNISVPLFNACAEHDHIVPLESTKALMEQSSSTDKHQIVLRGGHVSVVAGGNAVKRLWPKVDAWLGERSV